MTAVTSGPTVEDTPVERQLRLAIEAQQEAHDQLRFARTRLNSSELHVVQADEKVAYWESVLEKMRE